MSELTEHVMSSLAGVFAGDPRVLAAYLYGSSIDGAATSSSDVDVGVLFSTRVPLRELIQIETQLVESIDMTVDLVDVRRVGAFVALEIIRGGRFFCRDEVSTDEFDLYVLRRAGDLEPFERARRAFYLADGGG